MSVDDEITDIFLESHVKSEKNDKSHNEYLKDFERQLFPYEKCEELLDLISCNYKEKAQKCFKILKETLSNIVKDEQVEKFRRLKTNNKIVAEYLINIKESYEFLELIGFQESIVFNEELQIEENLLICKNANIELFNNLINNSLAKRKE